MLSSPQQYIIMKQFCLALTLLASLSSSTTEGFVSKAHCMTHFDLIQIFVLFLVDPRYPIYLFLSVCLAALHPVSNLASHVFPFI